MKVLVLADDDADDRSFFADALEELNYPTQLTTASDGEELMLYLEKIVDPPPPHLIFLDLNMPRKNGYECLKEIREIPRLKQIPIVIFSTTANENAIATTYALGANCFIQKPNSHQLLKKTIEAVLLRDFWNERTQVSKEEFFLKIS